MSEKKVINFQEAKARRALATEMEVLDTNDDVIDISELVLDVNAFMPDIEITDHCIIIHRQEIEEEL